MNSQKNNKIIERLPRIYMSKKLQSRDHAKILSKVTFSVLLEAQQKRYRKAGRKGYLSIEDKLLMALEYLREYQQFPLGT